MADSEDQEQPPSQSLSPKTQPTEIVNPEIFEHSGRAVSKRKSTSKPQAFIATKYTKTSETKNQEESRFLPTAPEPRATHELRRKSSAWTESTGRKDSTWTESNAQSEIQSPATSRSQSRSSRGRSKSRVEDETLNLKELSISPSSAAPSTDNGKNDEELSDMEDNPNYASASKFQSQLVAPTPPNYESPQTNDNGVYDVETSDSGANINDTLTADVGSPLVAPTPPGIQPSPDPIGDSSLANKKGPRRRAEQFTKLPSPAIPINKNNAPFQSRFFPRPQNSHFRAPSPPFRQTDPMESPLLRNKYTARLAKPGDGDVVKETCNIQYVIRRGTDCPADWSLADKDYALLISYPNWQIIPDPNPWKTDTVFWKWSHTITDGVVSPTKEALLFLCGSEETEDSPAVEGLEVIDNDGCAIRYKEIPSQWSDLSRYEIKGIDEDAGIQYIVVDIRLKGDYISVVTEDEESGVPIFETRRDFSELEHPDEGDQTGHWKFVDGVPFLRLGGWLALSEATGAFITASEVFGEALPSSDSKAPSLTSTDTLE